MAVNSYLDRNGWSRRNRGMIAYEVPLDRYPETYNGQPLMYMALSAQKNHFAVYTSGVHMDLRSGAEDEVGGLGFRTHPGRPPHTEAPGGFIPGLEEGNFDI